MFGHLGPMGQKTGTLAVRVERGTSTDGAWGSGAEVQDGSYARNQPRVMSTSFSPFFSCGSWARH